MKQFTTSGGEVITLSGESVLAVGMTEDKNPVPLLVNDDGSVPISS